MISLPKKPNKEIMEMLIKARHFLEHAILHSTQGNEFDVMISIHNLDNSIEYLLRIIIRHLEIEELTGKTVNTCELAQLIGEIQKFLKNNSTVSLSYVSEIKMIREMRNMVQHAMLLPVTDLQTYLNYGENFFKRTLTKIFGLSIEEIVYSTLIKNKEIKEFLSNAEENIQKKLYLEAVVECRDAFDYAVFIYSNNSQRIDLVPVLAELKGKSSVLFNYLRSIDFNVSLMSLDVDMYKYKQYSEYIDNIPFEYRVDNSSYISIMQREWEQRDAQFCYSFVASSILRMELNQIKSIYDYDSMDFYNTNSIEKIDDIIIPKTFEEYGSSCFYGDMKARLFFADKNTIKSIKEKIYSDKICMWNSESYKKSGEMIGWYKEYMQILGLNIRFIMNSPATWEITICYRIIPFSGDSPRPMLDIDTLSIPKLISLGYSQSIGTMIQNFRDNNGRVDTIEKAYQLKSILLSESNANYLEFFSINLIDTLALKNINE